MTPRLKQLQHAIYAAVTGLAVPVSGTGDRGDGPDGATLVRGNTELPAGARLQIYADAYFYRLLGVLREDYPATAAVLSELLGAAEFEQLIRLYLAACPPGEPSIFYVGRALPRFLQTEMAPPRDFVAELARLERTLIEVFHGADAPALDVAAMRALPPAKWPQVVVRIHPALCLLALRWRVGEVLRAVTERRQWAPPQPAAGALLVWRQQGTVYFRELIGLEDEALRLAAEPIAVAAWCERITQLADELAKTDAHDNRAKSRPGSRFENRAETSSESSGEASSEDSVLLLKRLLERWLQDGLLVRVA